MPGRSQNSHLSEFESKQYASRWKLFFRFSYGSTIGHMVKGVRDDIRQQVTDLRSEGYKGCISHVLPMNRELTRTNTLRIRAQKLL